MIKLKLPTENKTYPKTIYIHKIKTKNIDRINTNYNSNEQKYNDK